jgi:hypothetical protein
MTAETFVLPSHPPRIGVLPEPGTYGADRNRCILEVSGSFGPLSLLRRRCRIRESSLVIAPDTHDPRLTVEAEERGRRAIRFVSTAFVPTNSGGLDISGELSVRDDTVPFTLRTRVVGHGINRLLIIGTGRVHRIRLLLAADFR